MNAGNLETTNLLLGIMAVVSVLEGLMLVAAGIIAYRFYTHTMRTLGEIEERQIAPLVAKANALMMRIDDVLIDVKGLSDRTQRVDAAIRSTIDRVDETAGRVRSSVSARIQRVFSLLHATAAVIDGFVHPGRRAADNAPEHV